MKTKKKKEAVVFSDVYNDINRASNFNKIWFTRFRWIKPFVKSAIMDCDLAIAQLGDDMFLIKNDGELISVVDGV